MTREEAINSIKMFFAGIDIALSNRTKEALDVLIPELNESEDERIRKGLIDIFNSALGQDFLQRKAGLDKNKVIAYLEKQKEQKYLSKFDVDAAFDAREPRDNWEYIKEFCDKFGRIPKDMDELDELVSYVMDKKQKEQKPAEWDDYTETNLDRAIQIINKAKGNLQGYQTDDGIYECDKVIECLEHFLYRGLEMENSVKWKEDWREEDIQTRFAFYTYKDEPSVLYLSNVFVEKTCRTNGFGTRILKAAEKVAEVVGATTIRLKVKQDSLANAWYRKNGYSFMTFEDGYNWLEKNIEFMKPNKQEWNEEDYSGFLEEDKKYMEKYIPLDKVTLVKLLAERDRNIAESLESFTSVEQEKQEWSKEDERMRKGLINFLRSSFIKENITDETVAPWIAYLERRKPFVTIPATEIVKNKPMEMPSGESLDALADVVQAKDWKPSKEQMDILDKVYHYLWADRNATADMQDGLGDFIDDLKKLKGKEELEYYQHFDPDC